MDIFSYDLEISSVIHSKKEENQLPIGDILLIYNIVKSIDDSFVRKSLASEFKREC
jgi:hypothetical protein